LGPWTKGRRGLAGIQWFRRRSRPSEGWRRCVRSPRINLRPKKGAGRLRRGGLVAPTGTGRWTPSSGVRPAGARMEAAPPAPVGARGGLGRTHGCGQWKGASFHAGGSLAHDGGQGGGRPGGAQVREGLVGRFIPRGNAGGDSALVQRRTRPLTVVRRAASVGAPVVGRHGPSCEGVPGL
jgi:hypothetical protein